MSNEIYVSCHAPSFSYLLYETVRSVHDQKGLLIGQIVNEVISRKTDENEVNQEQKTGIYIEHCLAVEDTELFGNVGDINKSSLKKYLDAYGNRIIGWYSFRRNTRIVPTTMREMLIHQSLLNVMPHATPELFVAALMSASVDSTCSTHTYNHIFLRYHPRRGNFEALRLKIHTLSDKTVNSCGYSTKSCFPTAKKFDEIINSVQKEDTPVKSVLAIHQDVSKLLDLYNIRLQESENHRTQLEEEVKALKRALEIDNKEDVVVSEPDAEKDTTEPSSVRYYPDFKYNPSRKSNPFDSAEAELLQAESSQAERSPPVPDKEEQSVEKPLQETVVRSYSSVLNTSPQLVKTPKMRPGLGPLSSNRKSSVPNKSANDELVLVCSESDDSNGSSEKKIPEVNNIEHQNSMEY